MNVDESYLEGIYLESSEIKYPDSNILTMEFSWNQIFMLVAKYIFKEGYISRYDVNKIFKNEIIRNDSVDCQVVLSEDDIIRILVQLDRLELIAMNKSNSKLFNFTRRGQEEFQDSLIERKE